MMSTIFVSKFIFFPLLQKNHPLWSGLSTKHSTCLVWRGFTVFKGEESWLIWDSKDSQEYQGSGPLVLICELRLQYINGRAPRRLQIQDGLKNLAATAWSLISMTTLALPFDKALSCGKEHKRKTSQPRHMGGSRLILPWPVCWLN